MTYTAFCQKYGLQTPDDTAEEFELMKSLYAAGTLTRNEFREWLGLDPVHDGYGDHCDARYYGEYE